MVYEKDLQDLKDDKQQDTKNNTHSLFEGIHLFRLVWEVPQYFI